MKTKHLAIAVLFFASITAGAQANGGETLALSQAVDLAIKQGPDIRQAALTLESARAQYAQARASKEGISLAGTGGASHTGYPLYVYDPRTPWNPEPMGTDNIQAGLSFAAPITSVDLSASHRITEKDPIGQSTSVSLSVKQDVWDGMWGGRDKASADQARLTLQVKELDYESNLRSVATKVKQAYYTLLGAQRTLTIRQETQAQRQEESKRTQALFDADKVSSLDVRQAAINLASAQIDLRSSTSVLRSARGKLSTLIGWPEGKEYLAADAEDPPAPSLDQKEALQTALAQRIDLRQMVLSRQSSEIGYALQKAAQSPVVNASGNAAYSKDWSSEKDSLNWSAGVTMSMPLYDSGLLDAQAKAASVQVTLLALQEESLRAGIAAAVQDDLDNVRDLTDLAALAAENLDLAAAQYELAQAQYDAGTISNLDLLTASVKLTTARANLAKAKNDAQLGILQLTNTLGK